MLKGKAALAMVFMSAALLFSFAVPAAFAGEVQAIRLINSDSITRAEIQLHGTGKYKSISLAEPNRLVLDFPESTSLKTLKLPSGTGAVKSVRTGWPVPGTFRVVFDLSNAVRATIPYLKGSGATTNLIIEWPHVAQPPSPTPEKLLLAQVAAPQPKPQPVPKPAAAPVAKAPLPPAPPPKPVQPNKPAQLVVRPLVIAIDAGHGGQDSGAVGPTGKYEKDITLAIARELAKQIDATPGLKAYLTRNDDTFIPLNERAIRAREAHADMFVSIHADAAENEKAKGSSVYVLSLKGATSQRARWLADQENASDLVGGIKLENIDNGLSSALLDMAQSGQIRASEDAARHVLSSLKSVGNAHKTDLEKANFAVLRTSDMPAMLVETAFISNREEERQLASRLFQRKIAKAVLEGIETFFTRQPPPGTLFAARARADALDGGAQGGAP